MLKPLIIEKKYKTPEIILDKDNSVFQITGKSIIIDAKHFYSKIINWFEKYFILPNKYTELILNFEYINSPTSIQLIKIINIFEKNNVKDIELKIIWMYNKDDEQLRETGKEFQHLTEINFILKEIGLDDFEDFDFVF